MKGNEYMDINLNEVHYFIELARVKNFTKAANNLFISQPALSKAIKNLELALDTHLIERNTKSVSLTLEGENFYKSSKKSLGIIESEISKMKDSLSSCKKTLTLGIPPVIGSVYFTSIIANFSEIYPNIEVKIIEEGSNDIKNEVEEKNLELGVVIFPIKSDKLEAIPLSSGEVMLVVSKKHYLANREFVDVKELSDENFITFNDNFMMYNKTIKACSDCGFNPKIRMKSSQWDFIVEMVSLNQGISILPKPIVERFKMNDISLIPISNPSITWDVGFIYNKNKYVSDSLKLFIEFTKDKLRT